MIYRDKNHTKDINIKMRYSTGEILHGYYIINDCEAEIIIQNWICKLIIDTEFVL